MLTNDLAFPFRLTRALSRNRRRSPGISRRNLWLILEMFSNLRALQQSDVRRREDEPFMRAEKRICPLRLCTNAERADRADGASAYMGCTRGKSTRSNRPQSYRGSARRPC